MSLLLVSLGACERPQDRPIGPELKLAPPEPANPSPDADTGRTMGPIADVNAVPQAGTLGQAGTFSPGGTMGSGGTSGNGGTIGSGGTGASGGLPGTGGRSIH